MKEVKLYNASDMCRVLPRVGKNGVAYFLSSKGIEPASVYKGMKRTMRLYTQEAFDAAVEIGKQMEQDFEAKKAVEKEQVAVLAKAMPPDMTTLIEAVAALDKRIEFLQTCLLAVIADLNIKVPE